MGGGGGSNLNSGGYSEASEQYPSGESSTAYKTSNWPMTGAQQQYYQGYASNMPPPPGAVATPPHIALPTGEAVIPHPATGQPTVVSPGHPWHPGVIAAASSLNIPGFGPSSGLMQAGYNPNAGHSGYFGSGYGGTPVEQAARYGAGSIGVGNGPSRGLMQAQWSPYAGHTGYYGSGYGGTAVEQNARTGEGSIGPGNGPSRGRMGGY